MRLVSIAATIVVMITGCQAPPNDAELRGRVIELETQNQINNKLIEDLFTQVNELKSGKHSHDTLVALRPSLQFDVVSLN